MVNIINVAKGMYHGFNALTKFGKTKFVVTTVAVGAGAAYAIIKGNEMLDPMSNVRAIKEAITGDDDDDDDIDDDIENVPEGQAVELEQMAMMNSQNSAEALDPVQE